MRRVAGNILLLCLTQASFAMADESRPAKRSGSPTTKAYSRAVPLGHGHPRMRDLKFTHLTTNDGLSQSTVTEILQDRRGFMWFATRDGLNRYDGNNFVVYKHNPNDPWSLSSNFILDLMEDDQGYSAGCPAWPWVIISKAIVAFVEQVAGKEQGR